MFSYKDLFFKVLIYEVIKKETSKLPSVKAFRLTLIESDEATFAYLNIMFRKTLIDG